jgi:hypothetical protein
MLAVMCNIWGLITFVLYSQSACQFQINILRHHLIDMLRKPDISKRVSFKAFNFENVPKSASWRQPTKHCIFKRVLVIVPPQ